MHKTKRVQLEKAFVLKTPQWIYKTLEPTEAHILLDEDD